MSTERQDLIEYLDSLNEYGMPSSLKSLPDSELGDMVRFMESVLEREQAGLDKLFESMQQTMKYIPDFLLQALTRKFIEPPIAARITEKLDLKQSVAVAKGLPSEYVSEVAIYLTPEKAANLLEKFSKNLAREVVSELQVQHPLRLLDILAFSDSSVWGKVDKPGMLKSIGDAELNERRAAIVEKIKK